MTTETGETVASAGAPPLDDQGKNQEEGGGAGDEVEIEWQPDAPPETATVKMVVAEGAESTLEVGKQVEIVGTPRSGSLGLLEKFMAEKGRWKVQFDSGASNNFKPENLRVVKLLGPGASLGTVRKESTQPQGQEHAEASASSDQKPTIEVGLLTDVLRLMKKTSTLLTPEDEEEDALRLPKRKVPAGQTQKQVSQPSAPKAAQKELPETKGMEEEPAETNADEGVVLAGKHFPTQRSLVEHIKAMQAKMDEMCDRANDPSDGVLAGEDMFLLYHLVMQHPKTAEKLRAPLKALRYGTFRKMKNKCFMLVFIDGSEEPISWNKSVKDIFNQGSRNKRPLPDDVEQEPSQKRVKLEPAELSRQQKGLRLVSEDAKKAGHPQADLWEYPLMDEERRCFVGLLRNTQSKEVLRELYEKILHGTVWVQPVDIRSSEPIPRKTAWMVEGECSCTYRYGGVDVNAQRFPAWMIEIMELYMPLCGLSDRQSWPNSCNLNLYQDGAMSVGWHADDEKLFEGKKTDIRIISLSLGCTRSFDLRLSKSGLDEGRARCTMQLCSGDLCTMEGLTQRHYQHRVPKEDVAAARLNLTWRWVTCHLNTCPLAGK
mmetsp:Transcript_53431/g.98819  ORF Transcript_53431/g.98819 Transcript_53431/m.98819 type:complete len:600 (-) Transcript_53431:86-1885(-)